MAAQIEPTDPWCFSITCALSPRTRQTHVQWLALPYPSRLTIYTFRKENTFINTMIVVDRELRAFFSCMAWRAIPGPLSKRKRRLDSLEAAQGWAPLDNPG